MPGSSGATARRKGEIAVIQFTHLDNYDFQGMQKLAQKGRLLRQGEF